MTRFFHEPPLKDEFGSFRWKKWFQDIYFFVKERALFASTTAVTNSGAAETDLFSATIKAGQLDHNGDGFSFFIAGTFAATANNKRLRIYLGATLLFDTGALAIVSATDWQIMGQLVRVGSASQKCSANFVSSSTVQRAFADYGTAAENLETSLDFKITGTATATNDIVAEFWKGNFLTV